MNLPDMLPNIYVGDNSSVIGRLFTIFIEELAKVDLVLESLRSVRDIDAQNGKILDLIGAIVRENRQGKEDPLYRVYLYISIRRIISVGSVEDINEILSAVLPDFFLYINELHGPGGSTWGNTEFWMDGSSYLAGEYYLSGSIFQPAFFRVFIKTNTTSAQKDLLVRMLSLIRGGGIFFKVVEV